VATLRRPEIIRKYKNRLLVEGLALGALRLLFPMGMAEFLGVPVPENNFCPTQDGGGIHGIGIVLLIISYGFGK